MASSLPVIATDVGGNPELVENGVTGRLVPPSDPIGMADAIMQYSEDGFRRSRHGRAGREKVERRFSMGAMVDGYLRVYDSVLQSSKSPVREAAIQPN
jgi:glycosyltransferase involved in cell wall biosynthesis